MRESPLWHCVSTAKCLYLSEPQFQPKEENSLLELNPIERPAQFPVCAGDGPGVSFFPSPRCLGHHTLLLCLPLPPAAPQPRPGIFLHQQQVLHGSSGVSLSPVGTSGGRRENSLSRISLPTRSPQRGCRIHSHPSSSCSNSSGSALSGFRFPSYHGKS